MKSFSSSAVWRILLTVSVLAGAFAGVASAQSTIPVVTLVATDPVASVSGDTGTFTLFRDGDTNSTLNVYCRIGGTASNGVDYALISNWAVIPAGARSNSITITPVNNGQTNTQTVVVQLASSPLMMPVNYVIGYPSNAVVYIEGTGVKNIPPSVKIVAPTNGAAFTAPANIPIVADARDSDGSVATVEFFAGTNSLGIKTNNPLAASPVNPFALVWSNAPPGNYALTAVATDDGGDASTSEPVEITVRPPPPLAVVTVVATDPNASEPGVLTVINPGVFTVYRDAGTNNPLRVFYSLGGTASNGVDYVALSNSVVIPPGAFSADVVVYPLPDKLVEGTETVVLQLEPVACPAIYPPPPGCYVVGSPNQAVVYIADTTPPPTNVPPVVRIPSPANGSMFRAPVDIPIYAYANDPDGSVASVEFFAGTNSLGLGNPIPCATPQIICANCPPAPPPVCPTNVFLLVWSNAPPGSYALAAKATDNGGASTVSDPVNVTILPPPPPPTNRPPIVSIVATVPMAIEGTNCWVWPGVTNSPPAWTNWPAAVTRLFTNCGPKNAIFTVRRFGDTNDALTVIYDIGGTATNGVDYVTLPGAVTIPAGERIAMIAVVPLDDGPPDITSTVILKLTPSTNAPSDYILGFPRRAAAIIVDGNFPRPVAALLPDGCFHLGASGPDGAWFSVEYSTDLQNWTPICTNQVVNGAIDFVDPDAPGIQNRFYRAVPMLNPPPE